MKSMIIVFVALAVAISVVSSEAHSGSNAGVFDYMMNLDASASKSNERVRRASGGHHHNLSGGSQQGCRNGKGDYDHLKDMCEDFKDIFKGVEITKIPDTVDHRFQDIKHQVGCFIRFFAQE